MNRMTTTTLNIRGIYRDVILGPAGDVERDSGWVNNTIVTRCRVLIAGLMRNETAGGIQYLAVGRGSDTWDTTGIPPSNPETTTDLVQRYTPALPFAELDVAYLDAADEVQSAPSPRLQITATLGPGYPAPVAGLRTYPLREFGLFGRLGDTDYMINSIRHPVIHKDEAATLIRVVRLYF
jgi:hypothetical protein